MDKTLLDPPSEPPADKPAPSPMPPPSTPDNSGNPPSNSQNAASVEKAPSTPKSDQQGKMTTNNS